MFNSNLKLLIFDLSELEQSRSSRNYPQNYNSCLKKLQISPELDCATKLT